MSNNLPNPKVDVERINEIKKASFWISQFFILIATVVGVFLAASQGYKQAVQFENMTSYKENYYLQKSLQYELQDNIGVLKNYMERIQDGKIYGAIDEPLDFYNLVWDNMKFSKTTLGTPPEFLRESQHFYREVNKIYQDLKSNKIITRIAVERFQKSIDQVETTLIPGLEKSTEQIKQTLSGTDIIL